ncbi:MAG TPA: lysophospholipase, partial [Balneola sp.]|nr:lysophospholipase [Balneola sp.]
EKEPSSNYDLVSLLIGVNNQYRGYPIDQYKKEFKELLLQAITFANGDTTKVFVVSIPNYGVTPFGMEKGEDTIRQELLIYDSIADSISSEMDIPFINITPVSEKAKEDPSYIASDQLHPSGKQYKEWVELILPEVKLMLNNSSSSTN